MRPYRSGRVAVSTCARRVPPLRAPIVRGPSLAESVVRRAGCEAGSRARRTRSAAPGVPLDGQRHGEGDLHQVAAVVHQLRAGAQIGRGEGRAGRWRRVQPLGEYGVGGTGGQQRGSAHGETVTQPHGIELTHREGEEQPGGQYMSLRHGIQQGLTVGRGEEPGTVQQPQTPEVHHGRHRREEQHGDGPRVRRGGQGPPQRAGRQGPQHQGQGTAQDEKQRRRHADHQMPDDMRGERSAGRIGGHRRGHRQTAGGERRVPRPRPCVAPATQTARGQQVHRARQGRARRDAPADRVAPGRAGACRDGMDVLRRHVVGPARERRAARRARAQPMSSRARPPRFHAQS